MGDLSESGRERHLWVRGDRATYKIHLGSGSVLIEPGSRYLCIVRSGSTVSDVFLPFDGDAMLSLILSKAHMLAADKKNTDGSILWQLAGGSRRSRRGRR